MATKIQIRRDTAADWTSANPTLAAGEFGWESDTNRFKIGDGATAWTSLAYASDGDTAGITFVGDDSTGTLVSQNETFKIAGGTGITTAVSGDTMTITASGSANTGDITFTGSTIQSPSNADITLEPGGTGDVVMPAISFQDNLITTNRSNDDLNIQANGTGIVDIGTPLGEDTLYPTIWGSIDRIKGLSFNQNQTISAATSDRTYASLISQSTTLNGSGSSSNLRARGLVIASNMDMAGYSGTSTNTSTGPMGATLYGSVLNTGGTASTLNHATGGLFGIYAVSTSGDTADLTLASAAGIRSSLEIESYSAADVTLTDGYNYTTGGYTTSDSTGVGSITNHYGYHFAGGLGTNNYAFYDASNSLSVFGDIQTQAVSITDNLITTNRSNDNLNIEANGTGQIQIRANGGDFSNFSTSSHYTNGNLIYYEDLSDTIGDGVRHFTNQLVQNIKLTGSQSSSNSNDRWRNQSVINLDLNGSSSTATSSFYRSRGPMALEAFTTLDNTSGTNSTLGNASGGNYGLRIYPTGTGNITITGTTGMGTYLDVSHSSNMDITITDHVAYESMGIDHYGSGTGNFNITDHYHFRAGAHGDNSTATLGLTNNYGFYFENDSTATNTYAFYDASNSLSVFGDIQTQAVSITDNLITTNRSNDDLNIQANGTGRINAVAPLQDAELYGALFGSDTRVKGFRASYENLAVDADTLTEREHGHAFHLGTRLTNGSSTNNNFRPRGTLIQSSVDLDGNSYTVSSTTRGPLGAQVSGVIQNSSGTAATLATLRGIESSAAVYENNNTAGDITITNAIGNQALMEYVRNGSGDITVTNSYGFHSSSIVDHNGTGTATITNDHGFYVDSLAGTNKYAFYDNTNSLSRFGAVILANQASDPSTVTDSAHIYAKDVSSSSEVFVRDEAGNVTQISPHNEAGEWQYWSQNVKTGKKVRINMERMIRKLEEITGETFIENE